MTGWAERTEIELMKNIIPLFSSSFEKKYHVNVVFQQVYVKKLILLPRKKYRKDFFHDTSEAKNIFIMINTNKW